MRVAIDCRSVVDPNVGERAGVGYYTDNIIRGIVEAEPKNEYFLFFRSDASTEVVSEFEKMKSVSVRRLPKDGRFFSNHFLVALCILKCKPDVFFAPANFIPLFYFGAACVTVHDLAIYFHPEWFKDSFITRFLTTRILLPISLKRARAVICPSRATADDCRALFSGTRDKVFVVHHGGGEGARAGSREFDAAPARASAQDSETDNRIQYFLSISTIEPRKNLISAVNAFDELLMRNNDFVGKIEVRIAGGKGWKSDSFFARVTEINERWKQAAGGDVINFLGYISDREKYALYSDALALIYPSFYEGFGMQLIEAMSVSCPVIASNAGSIPEVVGEAGILVPPSDVSALCREMQKIISSPELRADLKKRALVRAADFTWKKAGKQTLEIITSSAKKK